MLTSILEKLILSGKAQAGTFTAFGRSAVLEIPQGKHAIITEIKCPNFIDVKVLADFKDAATTVPYCLHQLRIGNRNNDTFFVARTDINSVLSSDGSIAIVPIGEFKQDCYIPVQEKVFIEWIHAPVPGLWSRVDNQYPAKFSNKAVPVGYGSIGAPAEVSNDAILYNDPGNNVYRPRGKDSIPIPGTRQNFQFNFPTIAQTILNQVAMPSGNDAIIYTLPITTISYVLINGTQDEFVAPNV
jgi:hypothetical protein